MLRPITFAKGTKEKTATPTVSQKNFASVTSLYPTLPQPTETPIPSPTSGTRRRQPVNISKFLWPAEGTITTHPEAGHMAVDIANRSHVPVRATSDGVVSAAECVAYDYGCYVTIEHANGYRSLYGHLSEIDVRTGQQVSQGSQVGLMGRTGRASGNHLHFEIRKNGVLLNPLSLVHS